MLPRVQRRLKPPWDALAPIKVGIEIPWFNKDEYEFAALISSEAYAQNR